MSKRSVPTPQALQDAVIYRRAARKMEKEGRHGWSQFSCDNIGFVCGLWRGAPPTEKMHQKFRRLRGLYESAFRPEDAGCYWGRQWSDDKMDGDDSQACRILALCFMAAMVEAGDA